SPSGSHRNTGTDRPSNDSKRWSSGSRSSARSTVRGSSVTRESSRVSRSHAHTSPGSTGELNPNATYEPSGATHSSSTNATPRPGSGSSATRSSVAASYSVRRL